MILVWGDVRAFQRHLEDMGRFRRSHEGAGVPGAFQDMPALFDVEPEKYPDRAGAPIFTRVRGRPVIVPIWKIDLPGLSRN
jgi:hypothetical protein